MSHIELQALLVRKLFFIATILFFGTSAHAQITTPDPYLLQAFDGIWKMERSATSLITDRVDTYAENGVLRHEPHAKDSPVYLRESYESAQVEYRRKKYSAIQSQWGNFPQLNPDTIRLLEIAIPQTKYIVFSGQGEGLFSATDYQRYRFIHVFDMGRNRYTTQHYAVFADAHLGERVLGRLPNSPVLNYARLVPSSWDTNNTIIAYEILLYNLDRNGITRTQENELPVSYKLSKNVDSPLWTLSPTTSTPIADELDSRGHYFTGARIPTDIYKAQQLAMQQKLEQQGGRKNKSTNKKIRKNQATPVTQR
ncbi:hypothetical protein [Cellvibrio sp. pealriver]|uniref:hypothetical protein n=1 Tax=Cellvibrio sp. pealriver TaxID=1622269 RepID=UPI00066FF779|nr:hypothetical protein [Cellvibrio sp. pealriver]